jgi:hypothetical protein
LPDVVETTLQKLFVVRYGQPPNQVPTFPPARNNTEAKTQAWPGRIPAVTDTKMIVAWNSLMISGLARAATVFKKPDYLAIATAAAKFIVNQQWVNGRLQRLNYEGQPAVSAQSEDYALFIKALLDLQQASLVVASEVKSEVWLAAAVKVQAEFDEWLWSLELGGYYNTASDASSDLVVRERSYVDNATPAANGVAIANLIRLALLTENLDYLDRAEHALFAFSGILESQPQSCPSLFVALDWYQSHTLVQAQAPSLPELATQSFPTVVFAAASDLPPGSVGLVCQGLTCQAPAENESELLEQVQQSLQRSV